MKRTPIVRRTPLARRKTRLRSVPSAAKRRTPVSLATPEQKRLVEGLSCIVLDHDMPCAGPIDPAHIVDRSLAPSFGDDPLIVIPLCRSHHDLYDNHELDLSPYLEPRWREQVACAVKAIGLFQAVRRITGKNWQPIEQEEAA